MSNYSQFLTSFPVGTIIQSPTTIADTSWLRADGSIQVRATYPAYSAQAGTTGTFTPTVRAASPTVIAGTGNTMASNGTNMIFTTGGTALTGIQFSTNGGVTWSNATSGLVSGASFVGCALAGTNFVAAPNTTSQQPVYAAASSPGVWTSATGVTLAAGQTPTIAANTSGTVLIVFNGVVYVSTNSGVSYSVSTGASTTTGASPPVAWTGTQWLIPQASGGGNGMQTSPTGASGTWTSTTMSPWGQSYTVSSCVSDGANNVLITSSGSAVAWVSTNGGTTWRSTLLPQQVNGPLSYANGRFFAPQAIASSASSYLVDGSVAVSSDLLSWVSVPNFALANGSANTAATTTIAYAQGNYAATTGNNPGSVYTSTEDTTKMYLPTSRRAFWFTTNWQEWIKVQ